MKKIVIEFKDVSFSYNSSFNLNDASFSVSSGEYTFFIGPNGAGKTTLFRLMTGLVKPDNGSIFIDELDIKELKENDLAKRIAIVSQETNYTFPFTVEEVVLMGRFTHSGDAFFDSVSDLEKVHEVLNMTHVFHLKNRSITTLSGGEKRRVEIARALAQEANILLLDEPTVFLDLKQQRDLFVLLDKLHKQKQITICVVSHNMQYVKDYAERLFFVKSGSIEELNKKTITQNPEQLVEMF